MPAWEHGSDMALGIELADPPVGAAWEQSAMANVAQPGASHTLSGLLQNEESREMQQTPFGNGGRVEVRRQSGRSSTLCVGHSMVGPQIMLGASGWCRQFGRFAVVGFGLVEIGEKRGIGKFSVLADFSNSLLDSSPWLVQHWHRDWEDAGSRGDSTHRRREAFKQLGRKEIPTFVVKSVDDALKAVMAERDENVCRKDFTLEEAIAVGETIERLWRPRNEARQVESGVRGAEGAERGKEGGRGNAKPPEGKVSPKGVRTQDESTRTTTKAAKAVGMSRRTYEKAKAIVASGDRKLIDEMNRTGKVNGVHKKMKVAAQVEAIKREPPPLPTLAGIAFFYLKVKQLGTRTPHGRPEAIHCRLYISRPRRLGLGNPRVGSCAEPGGSYGAIRRPRPSDGSAA